MTHSNIAVTALTPELIKSAEELAASLQLPYVTQPDTSYNYLLIFTAAFLGLQINGSKSNPLYIDFLSAKMQYRRKHASLRKELLARALGLKNKTPRTILDATAGLARDSYILASLGFEIDFIERSPIIHALIQDAMRRAMQHPKTKPVIERMHLIHTNAISYLSGHKRWDIIYLDPMFPERKKSALSKQDMRLFHEVVGHDDDADALLKAALTCANQRVVVKRPRLAEPLAGLKPTLSMEGSSNRFDIYLIRDRHGNSSSPD